jgi:hypothetical protein
MNEFRIHETNDKQILSYIYIMRDSFLLPKHYSYSPSFQNLCRFSKAKEQEVYWITFPYIYQNYAYGFKVHFLMGISHFQDK